MTLKAVLLAMLVCSLLLSYSRVEGGRTISKEEDQELERQLNLLNKPAVKTIQTKHGDIYDCVDFYKQPAFDHPLLKNHTFHFQMRPSSIPKVITNREFSNKTVKIGLKKGCPTGTVPIRRTTKEDLIRVKLYTERYGSTFHPLTTERPGLHHAVVRTRDPYKKYNGAGSEIIYYRPIVNQPQYSSGQMKVQNGPESIQVGWTVNPALYGDTRTRLFTFMQAAQTSCFNTQCPGFVIVDTEIPLDTVLEPTSTVGKQSYKVSLLLFRDKANGNWWLHVGSDWTQIGFWPGRIFSDLAGPATYIDWGGEAFSPPGTPGPAMGSGLFPTQDDSHFVAYSMNITTIDENNVVVDAENLEEFADNAVYGVRDKGYMDDVLRQVAFWGGPGGQKH